MGLFDKVFSFEHKNQEDKRSGKLGDIGDVADEKVSKKTVESSADPIVEKTSGNQGTSVSNQENKIAGDRKDVPLSDESPHEDGGHDEAITFNEGLGEEQYDSSEMDELEALVVEDTAAIDDVLKNSPVEGVFTPADQGTRIQSNEVSKKLEEMQEKADSGISDDAVNDKSPEEMPVADKIVDNIENVNENTEATVVTEEKKKNDDNQGNESIAPKNSEKESNKADIAAVLVENVEEIGNDGEAIGDSNEELETIGKGENDAKIEEIKAKDIAVTKEATNDAKFEDRVTARIYQLAADHAGSLLEKDSVRGSEKGSRVAKTSRMTSLLRINDVSMAEQEGIVKTVDAVENGKSQGEQADSSKEVIDQATTVDNTTPPVSHVAEEGEKAANDDENEDGVSHATYG